MSIMSKTTDEARIKRRVRTLENRIGELTHVTAELTQALRVAEATIQRLNPTASSTQGTLDVIRAAIAKATTCP